MSEEILSAWENRARKEVSSSTDLLRSVLRNALPRLLGFLGEALAEKKSRGLLEAGSKLVREHAEDRARHTGYAPDEIVQELELLREIVTSQLEEKLHLSQKNYETIQKTFDQAIRESLMEFFLVHASLKEQFTATLSHDLRNPLSAAKMSADLILQISQDISDEKTRKDLIFLAEKIITNLKRTDRMIQDLLDATLLRLGMKLSPKISKCNLMDVIREVVGGFAENERRRIVVSGSVESGDWDCEGLQRALENLVKNAFKYGSKDQPIQIQVSERDHRVRLSVHNVGNPIPEHEMVRIFQPFRRSRSAQSGPQQGWGIGLALVKAVAESLEGTATVESDSTHGTTFTIEIPRKRPQSRMDH